MSQIFFKHGVMNSGKSMHLITSVYNYTSKGDEVLVLKPAVDTRSATGFIESRTGARIPCIDIPSDVSISALFGELYPNNEHKPACIFVDECQFLSTSQVHDLVFIASLKQIPVICYGLRTTFQAVLFPAVSVLMAHAHKIEEIKTICHVKGCTHKAMYNLRLVDGQPVFYGDNVQVGDVQKDGEETPTVTYIPKCRDHYFGDLARNQKNKKQQ